MADPSNQDKQIEKLEQQAVEGWLNASEKLDKEVARDRAGHNTSAEVRDLRREVEALQGLNQALDRVLGTTGPQGSDDMPEDDPTTLEWIRENVEEIQIRIGALADEISSNSAISEEVQQILLGQYEDLREELDLLESDPSRAGVALDMLRKFVSAVARYMEKMVRDVVHDWLPVARVLLPLLGPGNDHLGHS